MVYQNLALDLNGVIVKELRIDFGNFDESINEIKKELLKHKLLIVNLQSAKIGKWGLARLWRSWMGSTAKVMAQKGVNMLVINKDDKCIGERPFNANDAHELFTIQYLSDEKGKRLSWSKKGRDDMRQATRGERVFAMQQHQQWMIERGINHLNPKDSDYMKAIQEQNR